MHFWELQITARYQIKSKPEDFIVREKLKYEFSGEGEHSVVLLRKKGTDHQTMLSKVASWSGVSVRDIGFGGRKDKDAVTEQYLSLPTLNLPDGDPDSAIQILTRNRHNHRIRIGHTSGNSFCIKIRGEFARSEEHLAKVTDQVTESGFLNLYGPQRFSKRYWKMRDPVINSLKNSEKLRVKDAKWLISCLQSDLFNSYAKAASSEVKTGPMVGWQSVAKDPKAVDMEDIFFKEQGIDKQSFKVYGKVAKGARRKVRVWAQDLTTGFSEDDSLTLEFNLESGSYATVFVENFMDLYLGQVG